MPRKKTERLIQFNRDHILETAELLFSERGIQETTMDHISKAADCSKSTIYVYFKNKDEIYHCIIYSHMCRLHKIIDSCIKETADFEQCYYHICSALVECYEQYPSFFDGMMGNISIDEKEMEENKILQQIYEIGEAINDNMSLIFEKGIQQNYLRPDIFILPSVFTLWASLANIIRTSNHKENYILKRMEMKKEKFMNYSFELLLSSIKRR